jgi:peptide/nickel transport system permease protein
VRSYIISRLLWMIATLILVTIIVFLTVRLMPGDVIDLIQVQAESSTTAKIDRAAIEHALGLDVPVYVQYARWTGRIVLHGDLGTSLLSGQPVAGEILHRLPITLELCLLALVIGITIALPIGIYSAIRQDTWGDYVGRSIAIAGVAIPNFWLGTMVMIYPSIWWGWSPPMEAVPFIENPIENLKMFIIPAAIMGVYVSGVTMRMTRTMMLEVLRQDYIRTAWSKGLKERAVVMRHALKNALIPVITIVGLSISTMIGGAVIIEQIFALPGVGLLVLESLNRRDYTMVSGITLFIAVIVMVLNLAVDLTYGYLDPRVRYK